MTADSLRDDDSIQVAARNVLMGAAPERNADLDNMWRELDPRFQLAPDFHEGDRVIMDAGAYRYVRFNHRVMRAFWIAGFAAWEGYRSVAEAASLDAVDLSRFKELIAAFDSVIVSDNPELEPLPSGVAEPGQYPDKQRDPQGRAASELATIAVGWALLHELRHIRHQREGTGADPQGTDTKAKHNEEFSCDAFGTTFLLEQIDAHCRHTGEAAESVRQKRQLGIYFGLFAVALLAKDKWDASESHPSVQSRISAVHALMKPSSDIAEAIAHVAFAALRTALPGAPIWSSETPRT
jgi:hypothetical protein